jgi:hypothetical protein
VLLNEFDFSPRIEDCAGLKEAITCPQTIKYDQYENYYESLIKKNKDGIFSQYCSFQREKQARIELGAALEALRGALFGSAYS